MNSCLSPVFAEVDELSEMVNQLLGYSMVYVTVKMTNSPNKLSEKWKHRSELFPFDVYWTRFLKIPIFDKKKIEFFLKKHCLLAGKVLNGTESNINNELYFLGTAVQTGNF